jgi:uncharacterized RDD family membrane protein YckC
MIDPMSPPGRRWVLLPPGLRVAPMGIRIAAWVIDSLILGLLHGGFWVVAVAFGAVGIDPEAQRQLQASPLTLPTVAPYHANMTFLAVMMAVFVAINVAYATFFWAVLRGMPGQKLLSLQVGSAATGRNLSIGRALIRAILALGIPMSAVAGLLLGVFALETSVPWQDLLNPQPAGPTEAWLANWSGVLDIAILAAVGWPALLLIWTGANPRRQGLHDRLAGSLVVGKARASASAYYGYPAYGPAFGAPGSVPPVAVPPGVVPPGPLPPGVVPPDAWPTIPGAAGIGRPPSSAGADADQSEAPADAAAAQNDGPGSTEVPEFQPPPAGWTNPYGLPPGQAPGPDKQSPWLAPLGQSGGRSGVHVATVNRRFAAYAFDCVFVYVIYVMTASIVVASFVPSTTGTLDERTFILLGLAGGLEQLAYFAGGWRLRQGTIGQRLFRLKVADVTTGKRLGSMDAIVRWAVLQGPFALVTIVPSGARDLVILVAGGWTLYLFYTTIVDPDQRGLHDRFLNSRVSQEI